MSFSSFLQRPSQVVAIKAITKKNISKSQNLLSKEIKILKVRIGNIYMSNIGHKSYENRLVSVCHRGKNMNYLERYWPHNAI